MVSYALSIVILLCFLSAERSDRAVLVMISCVDSFAGEPIRPSFQNAVPNVPFSSAHVHAAEQAGPLPDGDGYVNGAMDIWSSFEAVAQREEDELALSAFLWTSAFCCAHLTVHALVNLPLYSHKTASKAAFVLVDGRDHQEYLGCATLALEST